MEFQLLPVLFRGTHDKKIVTPRKQKNRHRNGRV